MFPTLVLAKDRRVQKCKPNGEEPEKMHTRTAFWCWVNLDLLGHEITLPVFELSWNFPWSLPFTISYLTSVFSVLSLVKADRLRTSVPTATSSFTMAIYSGARKTGRYSFRSTTETVTVPRAERGSGVPRSVARTVSSNAECCESFRGFSRRITPVVSSIEKCPLAESDRE